MKSLMRSFLPQWVINYFYHLPIAVLANIFYGFPSSGLTVIGVTGTDGKTTTVNMIYQVLRSAGKKVSMVSTVNAEIAGRSYDTGFHVTSPDPFMVQRFVKEAKNNGDEYLILEVTSHALDQFRFWGINFSLGIITNVTHEHLDYHKTFQNYLSTKLKLIRKVRFAIINENLKSKLPQGWKKRYEKLLTFGLSNGDFKQKEVGLKLKIPGQYNLENAMAALACAFVLDIDRKVAQKALEDFSGVLGRMDEINSRRGIKIIIDFAHTPNALARVLTTIKPKKGKLWAVFGSAGKRDIEKREMMGEIAGKLADMIVITSEDPRGEFKQISRQITQGATKSGAILERRLFVIEDRQKAIEFALLNSKKGDVVGIFGKGHEKSMNLDGKREIPWSDHAAVKKVLWTINSN